jgi:hypothetical protein
MIIAKEEKYMQNKVAIYTLTCTIIMLLSVNMVLAEMTPWNEYWQNFGDTFLENVPLFGGPYLHADRDARLLQFYPVEQWEIEVCTRDITSMMGNNENGYAHAPSTNLLYEGIAVAISASRYDYKFMNTTLYNIEWYVLPDDRKITYSIYLKTAGGVKFYIPNYINILAEPREASSSYIPEYYEKNYTYVGIDYIINNSVKTEYLEAVIVYDDKASYG